MEEDAFWGSGPKNRGCPRVMAAGENLKITRTVRGARLILTLSRGLGLDLKGPAETDGLGAELGAAGRGE